MSEGIYQTVALGRQSVVGTAVAATAVLPVDGGFLGFNLDRASQAPDEDYGSTSLEQPGRESTGVRWATASLPVVARFQDFMHILEMHAQTSVTPTYSGGLYTWAYVPDESASALSATLKPYTMEFGVAGSTQDEWRAYGVLADTLELGFDALSAPGNSMWKATLGLVGLDRKQNAMTGALSAPSVLETMEGHLTTFSEGSTGTAFASLAAVSGTLKQFTLRSSLSAVGRAYGGTSDVATAIGRSAKGEVEFDALLAINSTTKTDILDIYDNAGSVVTERHWRIDVAGTNGNDLKIDGRVRFRTVDRGDHEGERLYAVHGVYVKSATLSGRAKFTLVNQVANIP
jgi:hypothetical protein